MGLRDYQIKAVNEFEESTEKNVLLQMATGAGKTYCFTEIAKRYFVENVRKVLILVHRNELLNQARISLGEKCFCISDGVTMIPTDFDYYIGMVETVNRRTNKLPKFGLVIIDECHIGNFKKMSFFKDPNTKVLGVTATPLGTEPLSNLFDKMIMPTDIKTLIESNYLLNCDVYGVASDLVGIQKFKTKGGDFDTNQLDEFYSSEKMVANVLKAYKEFSLDKKALIFNVNVHHNNTVATAFKNNGYNVYSIDGSTPSLERAMILTKYRNESNAILCNVGVLTTGFDEPSIQTIFLNRATKSLPLYLQMVGRGARLHESKDKFTVIDLGKNTNRFGFYDSFYDWEKFFKQGKEKGDGKGVSPTKECPSCGFITHTRSLVCTNCGHSFEEERLKQEAEEKEQKFYLLTQKNPINIPTEKIFELAKERGWKAYAVLHKIAEHIVNYQEKHKAIVMDTHCESIGIVELSKWCKEFNIKNNAWHKNYINNLINEKRKPVATADN